MNTELIRNHVDKIDYLQKIITALQEAHSRGKTDDTTLMIEGKAFDLSVIPSNELYPALLNIFTGQITTSEEEIKEAVRTKKHESKQS